MSDLAVPSSRRPRSTLAVGGAGCVVAGALQLLAAARALLPSVPEWVAPGWQVLGWVLGGLVLIGASVVLAAGRGGEPGIVGASQWARLALILAGSPSLLLAAAVLVAFSLGGPAYGWTTAVLVLAQAVVLVASTAAGIAVVRARLVHGVARWALLAVALVDAVVLAVALVPGAVVAAVSVAVIARPLVVLAVGVVLLLESRRSRPPAPSTRGEQRPG